VEIALSKNYVVDDNQYEKSLQKFVIMAVVHCVQKKVSPLKILQHV